MGIPAGAKAVTVTVTLLAAPTAGSIGIGGCGGTPWILPFQAGPTQVFSAVVRAGDAGMCVSTTAPVHVVLDITGAWTGTTALLLSTPARLFDSRATGALTTQVVERARLGARCEPGPVHGVGDHRRSPGRRVHVELR